MARWTPDPSFYPSPRLAMEALAEEVAYVALLNPDVSDGRPDALGVLDLAPGSSTQGQLVGRVDMPNAGDELHHFGWTPAAPRSARGRPTRTSSAATSSCPG